MTTQAPRTRNALYHRAIGYLVVHGDPRWLDDRKIILPLDAGLVRHVFGVTPLALAIDVWREAQFIYPASFADTPKPTRGRMA